VLGPLAAVMLEAILESYYARPTDLAEASYAGLPSPFAPPAGAASAGGKAATPERAADLAG
jgi:hypothetical protein